MPAFIEYSTQAWKKTQIPIAIIDSQYLPLSNTQRPQLFWNQNAKVNLLALDTGTLISIDFIAYYGLLTIFY